MRTILIVLVVLVAYGAEAFRLTTPLANGFSKQLQKAITSAVVATSIVAAPILTVVSPPGLGLVQSANADVRAQQKRTYFRFVPKLIIGRDFYKADLKAAIDKEDWPVVQKIFEEYITRTNKESGSTEATDTYVNQYLIRPMSVFSSSFAERGSSDKQRALLEQEQTFEAAMAALDSSVNDKKGGFLQSDTLAPTGEARKKAATEAWLDGKKAINEYIRIANEGLMRELNKIDQM